MSAKSFEPLYAQLGTELFEAKRYADASDALLKALGEPETGKSRANIHLTLGKTYSALGKDSEALKSFADAVRLDPDTFPEVEKELLKVQAANAAQDKTTAGSSGTFAWFWNILSGSSARLKQAVSGMAKNLYESEKYAEAEILFSWLANRSPKDVEALEYLGLTRLKQGKLVESIGAFLQTKALDSERVPVYQGLGNAYLALGENDKAVEALTQALTLKPDQPDVLRLQGVALRETGNLAGSEVALRRIIELEPENDSALQELATTLQQQGRNPDAASELTKAARLLLLKKQYQETVRLSERATRLDPNNGTAYLQLGQARIGQKQYHEALQALDHAAELLPSNVDVHILSARASFLDEELEQASVRIDRALRQMPELPEALGIKGAIMQRLEQYEDSLQLLDRSLELKEAQTQVHIERGHALEALARLPEAIGAYERATTLDPAARWAYARMGVLISQLDEPRYEDAASFLGQALQLQPQEEEAFYSVMQPLPIYPETLLLTVRGEALYRLDRASEAIPDFDRALELDPGNADASYFRGAALVDLSQYQEAVVALQLAVDLYAAQGVEDISHAYTELGEALRASGKYREAKTVFKQALARKPTNQRALARLGETLRVLDEPKEALKYLIKATELNAEDDWAWGALGATHESLQNYRSALQALDKAVQLAPNDSFSMAYKGKVFRDVKRLSQAVECFNAALEMDPDIDWVCVEKGLALREMPEHGDKEAITSIERAVQLHPESGYNLAQLAVSLYYLTKYADALSQVDKAIKLDPTINWANCLKSLILEKVGQTDESEQIQNQFLELFTGANAYFQRGVIYYSLLAYERAIRDIEEAIRLDNTFKEAYNTLAWTHTLSTTPDWDAAVKLAERAIDLAPDEGNYLDTLGWIHFKRGMFKEALPILERAAQLRSEDLEIEDHLNACRQQFEAEQLGVSASQ